MYYLCIAFVLSYSKNPNNYEQMRKIFLTLLMAGTAMAGMAKDCVVTSPNGKVVVTLNDDGGKLSYNVRYQDVQILEDSPLGIVTDRLDFTKGVSIENCTDPLAVEKAYELRTIKQHNVSVDYRQILLTIAGEGGKMEMEWMVSDRDVAYRYKLLPIRRRDQTLVAVVKSEANNVEFVGSVSITGRPRSKVAPFSMTC